LVPRVRHLPRWRLPDLDAPEVVAALRRTSPQLLVAAFYPRIIPRAVLDLAPGINVHPSDLPRWRGPDPCAWAIRAGDTETAVCVHWLTAALDEGDVLYREPVVIGPRQSAGGLAARMEALGAERVAEVAMMLLAGAPLEAQAQVGGVTWAPLVDAHDWEIDWTQTAQEVNCWVRAASPDPGAYTGLGDELLVVYSGAPVPAGAFDTLPPGTPYVRDGRIHVRCGSGALRLDRVRLGRRHMSGRALARLIV
jgi:methionyl-tRNA formyltransferase